MSSLDTSRNSHIHTDTNYITWKNRRKFRRIEESPVCKVKIGVYISSTIWREVRELVAAKYDSFHGSLSLEVEEALKNWLTLHTQKHTEINPINPTPKAKKVWEQVKDYIRMRQGFIGQQITLELLREAVSAIRGSDPRTVSKWLREFERYRLIKHIVGHVWEVV